MVKVSEFVLLSLVVCSVTCLNIRPQIVADKNEPRGPIDDSLWDLLDNLRYSLRCGFPHLGIPSLAPFSIESADINERGLLYNINGQVRNLTISGLDGYTVDTATLSLLTLRLSIGLTFPKVALNSVYNLDALLLRFLPIFGHGRVLLDVNDFIIQANGRMSLNIFTGRLNLTTLDINVDMGSIYSDTTGIYDSRIVSTVFNIALERMLRDVFENNKANIETALENLLIPLANQHLNELTLPDLISLIGGGSESSGPRPDPDTGEVKCFGSEDSATTVDEQSSTGVGADTTQNVAPTSTDEPITTDDKGFESTASPPDDLSNSSNFLFKKFQVMILMVATYVCFSVS